MTSQSPVVIPPATPRPIKVGVHLAHGPPPHPMPPHLWSSSGVLADNNDMTMDLPVPWRPSTPTTRTSV